MAIGAALLAAAGAGVVAHDVVCEVTFQPWPLCQRQDGSYWRGPSGCEAHNDPRCASLCDPPVADSDVVAEDRRESCGWLYRSSANAVGDAPYELTDPPLSSGRYVSTD